MNVFDDYNDRGRAAPGGVRTKASGIWSVKQLKREKKEKAPKPKKEKAPKPKKEKKAKKPKKGKKGAAPELENPEEGAVETGKKGKKKKLLLILLPVLVLAAGAAVFFFVIRPKMGGGKVEEEPPPEPVELPLMYTMGETEIHALPVWGESTVYLEEQEAPVEEDAPEPTAVTYRYEGLSSPGTLASVYTTLLTAEDVGFSQVDGELTRIKEPEALAVEAGSVHLAKNAPEEGKALSIQMDWTEEICTVTADLVDGTVRNPPEPASPARPAALSADQALDYIKSLDPAVLGLEGDSMEGYELLLQDGSVLIDNNPCVRINAYRQDSQTGSNEIGGNYFLSLDGEHLYRLDVASNSVEELDTPE